jgi:hypothetical protein
MFQREADYWTVAFNGKVCHLKDAKGMRYLAHLLRRPGVELKVVDLVQLVEAKGAAARALSDGDIRTRRDLGDAGPILDARAKSDYRRRLGELRSELEEAQRLNDPGARRICDRNLSC